MWRVSRPGWGRLPGKYRRLFTKNNGQDLNEPIEVRLRVFPIMEVREIDAPISIHMPALFDLHGGCWFYIDHRGVVWMGVH